MRYTTGSRISVDNKNATVVVTDWSGNPLVVKMDVNDKLVEIKDQKVSPIIEK